MEVSKLVSPTYPPGALQSPSSFSLPPLSAPPQLNPELPSIQTVTDASPTIPELPYHRMPPASPSMVVAEFKDLIDKCKVIQDSLQQQKANIETSAFNSMIDTANGLLQGLQQMQQSQQEGIDANEMEYELIRQSRSWKENRRPKYCRRSKKSTLGQICHSCHTSETPEWRRGPDGARTLCNACGLHYSKLLRKGSTRVTSGQLLRAGKSTNDTTDTQNAVSIPNSNAIPAPASPLSNPPLTSASKIYTLTPYPSHFVQHPWGPT
ncbi:GATA-domain-containing protein [Hesseltinella vesiculosa]|uniref:GATA-domain-containing protein n=1 Tax=Hesseltinella vesiculosa TaxID=101127 RepID=A0A1X2GMD0_9FUNG|nr:GATA-domain-containing protein [Hesseltinella vesiculosa]